MTTPDQADQEPETPPKILPPDQQNNKIAPTDDKDSVADRIRSREEDRYGPAIEPITPKEPEK